jgi:large subunit ribosomal protein L4
MAGIDVVDTKNNVLKSASVKEGIFDAEIKEHLVHEVVVMQMANRRRGTSSVKGRSDVSASSAKPWRQKGTGRARAGTARSPLWRGGGIIFGPSPRDFSYKVPKKVRKLALRSVLSYKVKNNLLKVVDKIELEEPKTKQIVSLMNDLNISGSVIFIVPGENRNLELSVRNLPYAKSLRVEGLNVYDLLSYDTVVLTEEALPKIEERLL